MANANLIEMNRNAFANAKPATTSINREMVSRCLAKAIAYKQCGKDREAAQWARDLVELLQCAEILKS